MSWLLVGTADSSRRQRVSSAAVSPRPAHLALSSTNGPDALTMPPSEPEKNICPSEPGTNTSAWWSGCSPFGSAALSLVMSVKLTPLSVERTTARPLLGWWAVNSSP